MNSDPHQRLTFHGAGFSESGTPREQARQAAQDALRKIGTAPPCLAIATGGDGRNMAAIAAETRAALPECTVLTCHGRPAALSGLFPWGSDGGDGLQLWQSDGTESGTSQLGRIGIQTGSGAADIGDPRHTRRVELD